MRQIQVFWRELWIWQIRTLLIGAAFCALLLYFAEPFPWLTPYLLLGTAIPLAGVCLFILPMRFRALKIIEDRGNLTVYSGWLFSSRRTVNLRAAVLVQIRRTPLQLLLRTATLTLQFPGGGVRLHGISMEQACELIAKWEKRRRI